MVNDIPPGFTRISGKRPPPDDGSKYHIHLRCGFTDTRIAYEPRQLVWLHGGHAGDILAVRKA